MLQEFITKFNNDLLLLSEVERIVLIRNVLIALIIIKVMNLLYWKLLLGKKINFKIVLISFIASLYVIFSIFWFGYFANTKQAYIPILLLCEAMCILKMIHLAKQRKKEY